MEISEDRLVDVKVASAMLGLSVETVRRLTRERRLPCIFPTAGRSVRYSVRDLEALLRQRRQAVRAG